MARINGKLNLVKEKGRKKKNHEVGMRMLQKEPGRTWKGLQGIDSCMMQPKKLLL